jgi:hypothetical protein
MHENVCCTGLRAAVGRPSIKQRVDDDREVIGMARNQCSAQGIPDRGARAEIVEFNLSNGV